MIQRAFVWLSRLSHGSEDEKEGGATLGDGFRSDEEVWLELAVLVTNYGLGAGRSALSRVGMGSTSEERIVMLLRILEARQSGTIEALSASSVEGDYSAFSQRRKLQARYLSMISLHSALIKSLLRSLVTFSKVNSSGPEGSVCCLGES